MAEEINRLAKSAPWCLGDPAPEDEELKKKLEEEKKKKAFSTIDWEQLGQAEPIPNDPYAHLRNKHGYLTRLPSSSESEFSDDDIDYDAKDNKAGGEDWLSYSNRPAEVPKEKWEIQQAVKGHRERNGMLQKLNEELTKEHAEVMEERLSLEVHLEQLKLQSTQPTST